MQINAEPLTRSSALGSTSVPFLNVTSKWTIAIKKTTCSSSLLRPSQKAFAGPTGSQTLAVCPPAALPLPLYECSSFGTSFPLDTGESKKPGAPLLLCKFPTDSPYLLAATRMKNHCGREMSLLNPLSQVWTAQCGLAIHEPAHLRSNAPMSPVHRDGRQALS